MPPMPGAMFRIPRPQFNPAMMAQMQPPPTPPPDFGFRYPEETQPRPMMDAYRDLVAQPPQRPNQGVLQTILAAISGGAAGMAGGPMAGIKAGTEFLDRPFENRMGDYKTQLEGAEAGARIEGTNLAEKNRFFRDFNDTRSRDISAQRDFERGEREEDRADREERRQADITQHYKDKAQLEREEFDARKEGGFFKRYPPKYIGDPDSGGAGKPPTQANMQKAEEAVTEEILARMPGWEKFVRRDPYSKRVTAIVGMGEAPTGSDAVEFEKFMMTRNLLAQRRLKGNFGLPSSQGSVVGSQPENSGTTLAGGGMPEMPPDYEY